ncbi:hypothetical protein D3C78_1648810 [compost metagenome]
MVLAKYFGIIRNLPHMMFVECNAWSFYLDNDTPEVWAIVRIELLGFSYKE